jgi:orotate phosphoribosyltransferase-like protein
VYEEEFCLSDKKVIIADDEWYSGDDIKEFIRKLKEVIMNVPCVPKHASEAYCRKIDKLSGGKLD